ncbi:YbhB/YbcL family Raf kinase inhibitor-like protein [Solirubrobacter sp. CPCC 204708]|uniref:YbhB/YbcL family Raf kinase inhibitor-like protein n=1 Tax=Solirubrobacter deserti TaxID=2282478 RepID=A0ABT4RIF6_9ACTN|nr:YbhB/YbcL family Raf kinase inhibitor-like protein [Solirubrobacter deserti]MBE2320311.1 YbhB/YbcL family Raf kinase inhibitor-like protein [Solirubrobacter deserti]MDA0138303.1 YbhB/YbcL family Raf kinase inhibitor-like protein [Solirubrobacter deserti]
MGARRPLLAAFAAAALGVSSCGGDDEPAASTLPTAPNTIKLSSPVVKDGKLPAANTCDGAGTIPTIVWREVPAGQAVETVLVVEDPDAEDGPFIHWTAFGISAATGAGLAPDGQFPTGTKYGKNSAGKEGWAAPCPPEGDGPHRYVFSMYALKDASALEAGAEPQAVLDKLEGAVARGTFTATYERAG